MSLTLFLCPLNLILMRSQNVFDFKLPCLVVSKSICNFMTSRSSRRSSTVCVRLNASLILWMLLKKSGEPFLFTSTGSFVKQSIKFCDSWGPRVARSLWSSKSDFRYCIQQHKCSSSGGIMYVSLLCIIANGGLAKISRSRGSLDTFLIVTISVGFLVSVINNK